MTLPCGDSAVRAFAVLRPRAEDREEDWFATTNTGFAFTGATAHLHLCSRDLQFGLRAVVRGSSPTRYTHLLLYLLLPAHAAPLQRFCTHHWFCSASHTFPRHTDSTVCAPPRARALSQHAGKFQTARTRPTPSYGCRIVSRSTVAACDM